MAKKKRKKKATKSDSKAAPAPEGTPQERQDGWNNLVNGLGTSTYDVRQATTFKARGKLTDTQLTALWRENGLAKRIIKLQPVEMTRNWFTVNGDDEDKVLQKLETLGAQEAYTEAMIWARLYGGSIILMGLDDGADVSEPVNEDRVKNVMFLRVFNRVDVEILQQSISADPSDPLFGEPTEYRIIPITGGATFIAHASRVIRFDGEKLPGRVLQANNWWNDSVLTSIFEQIRQLGAVYDGCEFIVNDFIQTIIKVDNLLQLIAQGKEDLIKERMNLLDMTKSIANTILLDSKEDYAKHASTVAGLDKLVDKFMMMVSAVTGIPVTLLMGRSPAGENATGESDIRMWYDSIRSAQRSKLRPRLEPLIRLIFKTTGGEPDVWSVEFNPLWEMTDKENAEVYKTNAEGDQIYLDKGVIGQQQIGEYRFGGSTYAAAPPTLDMDDPDADDISNLTPEEIAARQAEADAARRAAETE